MKAVILAAGRGTRLWSVTHGAPKCLLDVGGRSLINRQLDSLLDLGASQVVIVVGHGKERIAEHLGNARPAAMGRVRFVDNPNFDITNNMYSFWLARHWIAKERVLTLNADVLCHPAILEAAMASSDDISVVVDPEYREETTKVVIRNRRVMALSKSIGPDRFSGTFANVAAFSARGLQALFARAGRLFAAGEYGLFYNDVLDLMAREGERVGFVEVRGLPWTEIDDARDLDYARRSVHPAIRLPVPS